MFLVHIIFCDTHLVNALVKIPGAHLSVRPQITHSLLDYLVRSFLIGLSIRLAMPVGVAVYAILDNHLCRYRVVERGILTKLHFRHHPGTHTVRPWLLEAA